METELTQMILGIVATIATIGLAYLKQTLSKKGVSEEQADKILDVVEGFIDELKDAYPADEKIKKFDKTLRKLRILWDKEHITTDDIQDFLDE